MAVHDYLGKVYFPILNMLNKSEILVFSNAYIKPSTKAVMFLSHEIAVLILVRGQCYCILCFKIPTSISADTEKKLHVCHHFGREFVSYPARAEIYLLDMLTIEQM